MEIDPIALWRYQVIAPLLHREGRRGALRRKLAQLSEVLHNHPEKGLVHVPPGTLEDWLYAYRHHGIYGLSRKPRSDQGVSRCIDARCGAVILDLLASHPQLDGPALHAELGARGMDPTPSLTSLYRFMRKQGWPQASCSPASDRRAFAFEWAGDCWQGDIMVGPLVPYRDGRRRRSYLVAFIDDATRLVVHAAFYATQDLAALRDALKQALLKRGLPRRLYVDNGKIYRSRWLWLLAARLEIQLMHSRPYQPAGRGKLERFFRRVRRSFLLRLEMGSVTDLEALNRLFHAWLEEHYHRKPHRALAGETPLDIWMRLSENLRDVPSQVCLDELFLEEAFRKVGKDGTLALKGRTFEAGPDFIGQRICVRFDPADLRRVFVVRHDKSLKPILPLDREANRRVGRRVRATPERRTAAPLLSLEDTARKWEMHSGLPLHRQENNATEGEENRHE
jgi:transposase InsO family protein